MSRLGQRTEPRGTPEEIVVGWDVNDFSWMNWVQLERCEWNDSRGVLVISIGGRMVSKAALKSRRMRMERSPESVLPVLVTIRCTCTPAFCRELTGRPPAALEPAIPMATWRGIIGMGVDWMGLTLATGLSSPRIKGRLGQTQSHPELLRVIVTPETTFLTE